MISAATGAPVEINPLWLERNAGLYSGLTPEDGHKQYPPPAFLPLYQPFGITGESQWELYLRAGSAVQVFINHPPGKYVVISHGGILNLALYAILGIVPQANFVGPRFRFSNTGFASLTFDPSDHTWRLNGINDIAHLQTGDPKLVGLQTEPDGINAGEDPIASGGDSHGNSPA
jgi:2,3-bisphosphoglycerate-dependent phosphoglycerate mutase